jgi:hypothetical protein
MDQWYRPNGRQVTLHSVLVYFNEDFEGGATRFMEQSKKRCKYAMRTDVIYEADGVLGTVGVVG